MAEDKKNEGTKDAIIKSQAKARSNSQADLVEVEIIADGSFYKKGQKDKVHPTVAEILKAKGLIKALIVMLFVGLGMTANAQQSYEGYMAVKDTITNADTSRQEVTITGPKANITFQVNVIKLTGTVAGNLKVYGSLDGSTYVTTPLTTTSLTDGTVNYAVAYTTNSYKKYKVETVTTGTSTASVRTYLLYRQQP